MPFESNPSEPSSEDADGVEIVTVAALPDINTRDLRILAAMPTDDWISRPDLAERSGVPYPTLSRRITRLAPWYRTSRRKSINGGCDYQRTVGELRIILDGD